MPRTLKSHPKTRRLASRQRQFFVTKYTVSHPIWLHLIIITSHTSPRKAMIVPSTTRENGPLRTLKSVLLLPPGSLRQGTRPTQISATIKTKTKKLRRTIQYPWRKQQDPERSTRRGYSPVLLRAMGDGFRRDTSDGLCIYLLFKTGIIIVQFFFLDFY
jgi:hypothetical protein